MNMAKHYMPAGISLLAVVPSLMAVEADNQAQRIVESTGVRGGLIVHVGCNQGQLMAALRRSDRYVVQGLGPDPEDIAAARQHVRTEKLSESVSVTHCPGVDSEFDSCPSQKPHPVQTSMPR